MSISTNLAAKLTTNLAAKLTKSTIANKTHRTLNLSRHHDLNSFTLNPLLFHRPWITTRPTYHDLQSEVNAITHLNIYTPLCEIER